MPELPEVETIRRDLATELVGRTIDFAVVDGHRTVRRQDPSDVVNGLKGRVVEAARRKGKFLLLDLDDAFTLVVHLRMSGQLLWTPDARTSRPLHTHAVLHLEGGEELRFVDPRTFGEMWITTHDIPELWHLGPDALTELEHAGVLKDCLDRRKSGLKSLLMNQQVVAGIGNIYSDEILWTARLRQDRVPSSLTRPALLRLNEAIEEVLQDAVAHRGSSLADQQYVDLYGRVGEAQRSHRVYAREGQPCPRCEKPITRSKIGGRSSFACLGCQR